MIILGVRKPSSFWELLFNMMRKQALEHKSKRHRCGSRSEMVWMGPDSHIQVNSNHLKLNLQALTNNSMINTKRKTKDSRKIPTGVRSET